MTARDEFKAMASGPGKQLAQQDPDAYLDHIDATNAPEPVCGFCKGQPVGNAATWLDGKPRPPAACPRCGETNYPVSDSSSAAQLGGELLSDGSDSAPRSDRPAVSHRSKHAGAASGVSGSLVRGGDPDPSLKDAA